MSSANTVRMCYCGTAHREGDKCPKKYLTHTCCVCGHQWESIDDNSGRKVVKAAKVAKKVREAVKVNKDGPYCNVCHHLTMAKRYVEARGLNFAEFVVAWVT